MREAGENCQKYLKRGWNRNKGRGNKDFLKKGEQAGSGGRCIEKGGWNPLTNLLHLVSSFLHIDFYSVRIYMFLSNTLITFFYHH